MTHEETIQRIEDRYPMGSLEFQIKYCRTIMQAQMDDASAKPDQQGKRPRPRLPLTQVNRCHEMLSMHERALDMRQKLVQADINEELGQDSPHYDANNTRPDYDEYIRLRLLVKQAPTRQGQGRGRQGSGSQGSGSQGSGSQGSGSQGSGSFLDGSMSKKVPDPFRAAFPRDDHSTDSWQAHSTGSWQDNPHGLPVLPPGKSALDSIIDTLKQVAHAQQQEPRSAATPEINALFDNWSEKVAHWMQAHDYTIPPPRMDERLWKALEHDAQYDPNVNQWFHTVKQLNLMHEQAKNTAEFSKFTQQSPGQPAVSPPNGKAGGSRSERTGNRALRDSRNGEVAATSSSREGYRSQEGQSHPARRSLGEGGATEPKPQKLAKIIPGPGNPHFNTRA